MKKKVKEREIFSKIRPYFDSPEAIIITGMRRTGKTTLLNFIYEKIQSSNKLFLDLENPLNRQYFEEMNYEKIKFSLEILGINFNKKAYLFLDEIQLVKNLPSVAKYFIDHYKVKFFLTGSANFYLKNLFSESLAGRKYIFELFPLSFKEFLLFKERRLHLPVNSSLITEPVFKTFYNLYEEYVFWGGFPEVVLKHSSEEKGKSLEDVFSSFFQLEVLQLGNFKRNDVIRNLMLLLLERVGSKLDIQKLSHELGASRETIFQYISFLEDTYFIKTIKPFSRNRDTEIRKTPKVYVCDSGLGNYLARVNKGALFENSVFQSLRLKGELNYYQRKSGVEIDFILNQKKCFEVKISPSQRDLNKVERISRELEIKDFSLVSKTYSKLHNVKYGFLL